MAEPVPIGATDVDSRRGDPLPRWLAVRLRAVRHAHRLTRAHAAEIIGISPGHLWHLEAGDRRPSIDVAEAVITAYRLDQVDAVTCHELRTRSAPRKARP